MSTWQDAARGAGVDFEVEKRPLYYYNSPGGLFEAKEIKDRKALVRTDTGDVLSVVSDKYRVIAPSRIFEAVEPIRRLTGGEWADARAFKGGQIIAGTLKLTNRTFEARPGDPIVPNIVFLGGFSGNLGVRYFLSTLRLYCINVLARLLRSGAKSISVRHAGDVEQRMVRAGETVEEIVRDIEVLKEQIRLLTNTPATASVVSAIIGSVLPEPQAPAGSRGEGYYRLAQKFENDHAAWSEKVETILTLADKRETGNGLNTAWDVVNGITEYVDHTRSKQGRIKDPAEYITMGAGALAKATAFQAALEVAR